MSRMLALIVMGSRKKLKLKLKMKQGRQCKRDRNRIDQGRRGKWRDVGREKN